MKTYRKNLNKEKNSRNDWGYVRVEKMWLCTVPDVVILWQLISMSVFHHFAYSWILKCIYIWLIFSRYCRRGGDHVLQTERRFLTMIIAMWAIPRFDGFWTEFLITVDQCFESHDDTFWYHRCAMILIMLWLCFSFSTPQPGAIALRAIMHHMY